MNRLKEYAEYHYEMQRRGDLDPQYPALVYLADRFELNIEQRYWLAFLFACTYCVPTVYYIYNEFPDYENVDVGRLQRWWDKNKAKCLFQTDRLRMKTTNQMVPAFVSYRELMGENQQAKFQSLLSPDPKETYRKTYEEMLKIKNFGRYTMFLYLESVHVLTGFRMEPDRLDLKNALSCRNGLCLVLGQDDWVDKDLTSAQYKILEEKFNMLVRYIDQNNPNRKKFKTTVWNVETTLCAFKKLIRGKRWLNYYIDRQAEEIIKMQDSVRDGVEWSVMWDHRAEHFEKKYLTEFGATEERFK